MRSLIAAVAVIATVAVATAAEAAARVALVMGNGAYEVTPALANPVRDAEAMAGSLESLGFDVILATDADRRASIEAMGRFSRAADGAEIALFFFAGHGIQLGGENLLLPTDVKADSEWSVRASALEAQQVVAEMERRADVSIAILDACRNNPLVDILARGAGRTRSATVQRGLGPMRLSGRGAIIAFAAAAGDTAADGDGDHSPFTAALLEEIGEPNVEVGLMFRRVARRVRDATRGDQHPELLVRLVDEVYLNPTIAEPLVASLAPVEAAGAPVAEQSRAEEIVVADASRELAAPGRVASSDKRFFGTRVVHTPPWSTDITVPEPSGWRSAQAVSLAEVDGNDTYGTAQALPLAAAVDGRITPRGDADWYLVDVPTGGELRVEVDPAPDELDLYARVWDADHKVVADWQGAPRQGGVLSGRFPMPGPGRYWIQLTDGNNDGESSTPFTTVVDFVAADDPFEPNNSIGVAAPLPTAAEITPTIYPRGDNDWYKVWIAEPGLLTVVASGVPDAFDIAMRIWDLNNKVVRDWQVAARKGGETDLEAQLARPGTYLIQVADGNNDAESVEPFRLSVAFEPVADEEEPNNSFGEAVIVPPSGERYTAIFPRGDQDWLAIDVDHPGELWLSATDSPEDLDIYMRVWNSDKQVLRDWFGPARIGGDVEDFADLPAPGRYFIQITDGNNDQASATLFKLALTFTAQPDQYEPNNGPADAAPLTPGGQILFNILPRGDADWYRVEVAAPGELAVVIDESPDNLDIHFRVWDSDQKVVRDWVPPYRKGGVTEGFADLPAAGIYFIQVTDGNNDARSVAHATLTTKFTPIAEVFEPNNSFGRAIPIKLGEAYRANVLPRGDNDWYLLEAPRAGAFVVTVDEVDADLDIYVRLWDAEAKAGNWIGPPRKGGVTDAEIAVPAAGLYRLQVADGNNDARSAKPFRIQVDFR